MIPSEISELFALLVGAYPRQAITPQTADVYGAMLADLDFAEARRAILEHVAESPYFPAISEIRQRAAKRIAGVPGVDEAWAEVMANVSKYGARGVPRPWPECGYGPVPWSHPAVESAVRGVGWEAICMSETPGVERAHFRAAFEVASIRAVRMENVGRLTAHEAKQLARKADL